MNAKKANWAFLITIIAYIMVALFGAYLLPSMTDNIIISNMILEAIVFIPILIFTLASGEKVISFWNFRRIKFGTILMIGLFTFLTRPVMALFGAISEFWVENEVTVMIDEFQMADMSLLQLCIPLGVIAPMFEEVSCRGAFYCAYRKSASAFKAMLLSAVIFACLHMNFNQASYSVLVGILAVLLVEATGSLWSSIIYHGLINTTSFLAMYASLNIYPELDSSQLRQATAMDIQIIVTGILLIWSAVFLPLAFAVLVWIGKHEGREEVLAGIWRERKWIPQPSIDKKGKMKKDKLITVPLVLALILCLLVMTGIFFPAVVKLIAWLSQRAWL